MTMQKSFARFGLMIGLAVATMLFVGSVLGTSAFAQDTTAACEGVTLTGGTCGAGGRTELGNIISAVVDVLSIVVGALAVIFIIIGGLKYVTSGGDSSGTASAKNTIIYAIVGLLVVIFAQVIVNFAITESTGAGGGTTDGTDGGGDAPGGGGFVSPYILNR